jgi:membrane AbrB-like protein
MRWILLALFSIILSSLLQLVHLPAASMFGPMLAAVACALIVEKRGQVMHVPKLGHAFAQAIIGCLIARAVTPQIVHNFAMQWPLFVTVVGSTVVSSSLLGWLLCRLRLFPGTVAIWGLLPGAASAMMILAEEFGADARLVAFMQYLRVVCVGLTASLCARFFIVAGLSGLNAQTHTELPQLIAGFIKTDWPALPVTLALVALAMWLGPRSKIPAGVLLLPMMLGGALHLTGMTKIELPQWLLTIAYSLLGWTIGMRFTREAINHALKLLPQTLLAIFILIFFGACLAILLNKALGIDLLTAYLATSPGGMDTVAIIAASSKVDMSFIMALQTVRFLMVLAIGPPLSRLAALSLDKSGSGGGVKKENQMSAQLTAQISEDESELD